MPPGLGYQHMPGCVRCRGVFQSSRLDLRRRNNEFEFICVRTSSFASGSRSAIAVLLVVAVVVVVASGYLPSIHPCSRLAGAPGITITIIRASAALRLGTSSKVSRDEPLATKSRAAANSSTAEDCVPQLHLRT